MNSEPSKHKTPSGPVATGDPDISIRGSNHFAVHAHGLFQPGEGFYTIYHIIDQEVLYCSPSIENCLGIQPGDFNADLFNSRIHPADRPGMVKFEREKEAFYKSLDPTQIAWYKTRYSFRFRHASGTFIHLLYQSLPLEVSHDGQVIRIAAAFSDITWLAQNCIMSLSFIHLGNHANRIDVAQYGVAKTDSPFTPREQQVLKLLAEGDSNDKIAESLSISKVTVSNHRKKMLSKTSAGNLLNLVILARENGWI